MFRILLTPRWVAATLLMIAAVTVCAGLGSWQWDRATPERTVDPEQEAVSTLTAVLNRPDGGADIGTGIKVRASGRFDVGATTVVDGEPVGGRDGDWVVTPLVLNDGRVVPVVRGWADADGSAAADNAASSPAPNSADAPEPIEGDVVITGRYEAAAGGLDERFVALIDQRPLAADELAPVVFPVPEQTETDLRVVNALYAAQWWIFTAFWIFLWWRALRDEVREAAMVDRGFGTAADASTAGTDADTAAAPDSSDDAGGSTPGPSEEASLPVDADTP